MIETGWRPSFPAIPTAATAVVAAVALGVLPACGPAVVDHTPVGNILDTDTQSLEGGLGHWQAWFSTDVGRSTDDPHRGQASLRITVTAPDGWGVELDNWPGFPATPGNRHIDLWARAASGSALDLEVSIRWRNDAGGDLQTDELHMRPNDTWQPIGRDLTAPTGTSRASLELTGSEAGPGDALEVDEIFLL
jgi:hypothetical protein